MQIRWKGDNVSTTYRLVEKISDWLLPPVDTFFTLPKVFSKFPAKRPEGYWHIIS